MDIDTAAGGVVVEQLAYAVTPEPWSCMLAGFYFLPPGHACFHAPTTSTNSGGAAHPGHCLQRRHPPIFGSSPFLAVQLLLPSANAPAPAMDSKRSITLLLYMRLWLSTHHGDVRLRGFGTLRPCQRRHPRSRRSCCRCPQLSWYQSRRRWGARRCSGSF